MKYRATALVFSVGLVAVAATGCSNLTSSDPTGSPTPSQSVKNPAFCAELEKEKAQIEKLVKDVQSGNVGVQTQAIQQMSTMLNQFLSKLPANESAAISKELENAKSTAGSASSGSASSSDIQASLTKVDAEIKKQCPNYRG